MPEYNAFHTSGSATLIINNILKDFIKNHLIDINHDENYQKYNIVFNTDIIPIEIEQINGFESIDKNVVNFKYVLNTIKNDDAIAVMNNIKKILKTNNKVTEHPTTYYEDIMQHLLSVGTPYSSYIEIVLCNMFLTNSDPDNKEFWRYNPNKKAIKKYGDKTLSVNLSPTLGCLFQPNKNTLNNLETFNDLDINKLSIHERIWIGEYN